MLQPATYYFIAVFHFVIFLAIVVYLAYEKYKARKEKRQKIRIKKQGVSAEILSQAIYKFWNYGDAKTKDAIRKQFRRIDHALSISSQKEIREMVARRMIEYQMTWGKKWKKLFSYSFQSLFDQILKVKAEELDRIYKEEEDFRKTYQDKKGNNVCGNNSLSRDQIDKILKEKTDIEKRKEATENDFWELHDFLSDFGFKVWDSYKTYLVLKPSTDF